MKLFCESTIEKVFATKQAAVCKDECELGNVGDIDFVTYEEVSSKNVIDKGRTNETGITAYSTMRPDSVLVLLNID